MKINKSFCVWIAMYLGGSPVFGSTSEEFLPVFEDELQYQDMYVEDNLELEEALEEVDELYRGKASVILKLAKKFGPAAYKWAKKNIKWLIYVSIDIITDMLEELF